MKPAADRRMTVIKADSRLTRKSLQPFQQARPAPPALGFAQDEWRLPLIIHAVSVALHFLLLPTFFTLPLRKGLTKEEKSTFQVNSLLESMHNY